MKKFIQYTLLVGFFFALLTETYALYSSHFRIYSLSSVTIVPVMLIYGFSITQISNTRIYFYTFMLLSWAADILTLSSDGNLFYIGLSLYSFAYIFIGGVFFKKYKNKTNSFFPETYYLGAILLVIIILMVYFNNSYADIAVIAQDLIHVFIIVTITYWVIKLRKDKNYKLYFLPAVIFIIASNLLFALDQLVLHRKYPLIDALDVFMNGLYIFFVTKGVMFSKK